MIDVLRTWLFPPACAACDAPGPALCATCAPAPGEAQRFTVDGIPAFALGTYDGALRRAIVAMKHGERDPLDAFASLLAQHARVDGALVPLPTSRGRAAERGFDQAVELATRLAAKLSVPAAHVLEKRSGPQAGLTRRERLGAVDRFRIRRACDLPSAATLIDDVCTTSATIRDAVRLLRAHGVDVRRIIVLARTAAPAGTFSAPAGSSFSP